VNHGSENFPEEPLPMKKILLLACAALTFAACSKNEPSYDAVEAGAMKVESTTKPENYQPPAPTTTTRSQLEGSKTTFPISATPTKDPKFLTPLPEEMAEKAAHIPAGMNFKLPWEGTYRLSNAYGFESKSWTHQTIGNEASANDFFALDVGMPEGVEILAPADGVIITSQDRTSQDSYGNYMVIDHGNGIHSIYAHMSERVYDVDHGEPRIEVKQGQLLGKSGKTGTRYPHLHFALHKDSRISHSGADVGGLTVVPEPISGYYGLREGHELTSDNVKIE
jgi:murein DD-endopeptidase MepM/ murein hydrolase activator NlpD